MCEREARRKVLAKSEALYIELRVGEDVEHTGASMGAEAE